MTTKNAFIFAFLLLLSLDASAQRRRRNTTPPPPTPEELAEMARKEKFERKLLVTERVTFIDSLLLKKSEVMDMIVLDNECGQVMSYTDFFKTENTKDTLDRSLFRSQLGDKIIFSEQDANGTLRLYASEKIGEKWTEKSMLKGLNDTVSNNYPYMLADGATMYYASKCDEGLGGYDIYMTRWDADEKRFLKPENIGMPFNSEANDYLYVIDEFNNLGWFLTDRGQSADSACLYCFIPNDTRRIYNVNAIGHDTLVALANINSIRDTWEDKVKVDEARERLEKLKNRVKKTNTSNFHFIINDNIAYSSISQFRVKESRALAEKWVEMSQHFKNVTKQLESLRKEYAQASATRKSELKPKIKELEISHETLITDIHSLEKEIRIFEQR